MTTVLPVKIWWKTKELATWPDVAPEGENERAYNARVQQLLILLRTSILTPEINLGKYKDAKKKDEEPEEFMNRLRQVIIQHSGLGMAAIPDELLTNLFVEGLLPSLSKQIKFVKI